MNAEIVCLLASVIAPTRNAAGMHQRRLQASRDNVNEGFPEKDEETRRSHAAQPGNNRGMKCGTYARGFVQSF